MLFISIPLPVFIAIVVLIIIAVIAFFVIRKIDNQNKNGRKDAKGAERVLQVSSAAARSPSAI